MKPGDVFQIEGIGLVEVMHGSNPKQPLRTKDGYVGVLTKDGTYFMADQKDLKKPTIN